MRNLYRALLLTALLLLPSPGGECALQRELQAGIGTIKVPAEAWVTDFDMNGLYSFIAESGLYKLDPAGLHSEQQLQRMRLMVQRMDEIIKQLNMYNIIIDNGGNYQQALIMTFFLDKGLPARVDPNMAGRSSVVENVKPSWYPGIIEFQERIKRSAAGELAKNAKRKPGAVLTVAFNENFWRMQPELLKLDWPEIEMVNVNGGFGYKSDIRVAGRMFGFINSVYIKFLAYDVQDKGVAFVVLATMDNEHDFWAPVFADMLDVETVFIDMLNVDTKELF